MKRFLTRALIIVILLVGSFVYWKYFFTYSEGYRAGLLQKFSSKGTIFKTYEGEMILSSVQTTTNIAIASEKFFFSVTDDEVAKKMEKLQGEYVVVHYSEKNAAIPWLGETHYLVDSVTLKSDLREQTENNLKRNRSGTGTLTNTDLLASNYFKVDNISKFQYIDKGKFEMEFDILNNTDYKFSKFDLLVQINYKMKNSDEICVSTVQFDALKPQFVENWEPHTKTKFYLISPCWGCGGGCFAAQYERTPESITLILKPFHAISVNLEVEDPFAIYDLLPQWKERQVKEGFR